MTLQDFYITQQFLKMDKSIGVGTEGLVDKVKARLVTLALGRKTIEAGESYQLREPAVPYTDHFGAKKSNIEPENMYIWGAIQ